MVKLMDRNKIITQYIKNKVVLDIGFLGDGAKFGEVSEFHEFLRNFSKEIYGVDIDKEKIEYLKSKGYNAIYDNAVCLSNTIQLNKKFDVVVVGETLHYLSNLGDFLDNVKKVLKEEGLLIITLPNPYSARRIVRHIIFGHEKLDNNNNTGSLMYFTKVQISRLLNKYNFQIIEIRNTTKREYSGFRGNIEKLISHIFPRFASHFLIVAKVKK
jgi:2-polyprenyl-3-methyl-5-hydroxy-6-metoxy-1,4-benzoquinol methylase